MGGTEGSLGVGRRVTKYYGHWAWWPQHPPFTLAPPPLLTETLPGLHPITLVSSRSSGPQGWLALWAHPAPALCPLCQDRVPDLP